MAKSMELHICVTRSHVKDKDAWEYMCLGYGDGSIVVLIYVTPHAVMLRMPLMTSLHIMQTHQDPRDWQPWETPPCISRGSIRRTDTLGSNSSKWLSYAT